MRRVKPDPGANLQASRWQPVGDQRGARGSPLSGAAIGHTARCLIPIADQFWAFLIRSGSGNGNRGTPWIHRWTLVDGIRAVDKPRSPPPDPSRCPADNRRAQGI